MKFCTFCCWLCKKVQFWEIFCWLLKRVLEIWCFLSLTFQESLCLFGRFVTICCWLLKFRCGRFNCCHLSLTLLESLGMRDSMLFVAYFSREFRCGRFGAICHLLFKGWVRHYWCYLIGIDFCRQYLEAIHKPLPPPPLLTLTQVTWKYPDDKVGKSCKVFRVTSEW